MSKAKVNAVGPVSNGASGIIEMSEPYVVRISIRGVSDYLYHRWNCEAVAAKAVAAKGSKAKKTDDVESYVYRCENGNLGIPAEQFRQSLIVASKSRQDPRSPRKSAFDLFKAALIVTPEVYDIGTDEWSYLHQARVQVQRNGLTRIRPALKAGWVAQFDVTVLLPEYIDRNMLQEVAVHAGRLCGIGDFRPTYGRYAVDAFHDAIVR